MHNRRSKNAYTLWLRILAVNVSLAALLFVLQNSLFLSEVNLLIDDNFFNFFSS